MSPATLVDQVHAVGGRVILLLSVNEAPKISVVIPRSVEERRLLIEGIREHRNAVIAELRRRYLTAAILSESVQ